MFGAVVMEKADDEDWDFDSVMIAAEAEGSGFRGKSRDLLTKCCAVHTNVPAGLVHVVRMAARSSTLEEQLRESDQQLQKTQCELQVAHSAVLEAQHLALSMSEEARSCHQQLENVREQLDLAYKKVTSVNVASGEAAVGSKRELASLQEECDLSQQCMATAESAVSVFIKSLKL